MTRIHPIAIAFLFLATPPAKAQWIQIESPTAPAAITTTARVGEVVTAGDLTARGDAKGAWETGIAPLRLARLIPSPDAPDIVYGVASQAAQPLWRTVNGGRTWHELKTAGVVPAVRQFSAGPLAGAELYALGPQAELYSSLDGGFHWRAHAGAEDPRQVTCASLPIGEMPPAVLAHPRIKGLVFAVVPCGLVRSADSGRSWRLVRAGARDPVISPADNTMYAKVVHSTFAPFVQRSRDHGDSWEETGVASGRLFPDRFEPNVVWAADASQGFSRSPDGGRSWSGALAPMGASELFFPAPGEYLTLDFAGHLRRWDGASWITVTPPGTANVAPVGFAVRDDGGMLLSGEPGLFARSPGGGWENRGSSSLDTATFARGGDGRLYGVMNWRNFGGLGGGGKRVTLAAFDEQGNGQTLADFVRGSCKLLAMSRGPAIEALVMCTHNPLFLGGGTLQELSIWRPGTLPMERQMRPTGEFVIAAAWSRDGVITLVTASGIYRGGELLFALDPADPPTSFAVQPGNESRMFLATRSGVRESADGGRTWTPFELGTLSLRSAVLSATTEALHAATPDGIFRCEAYRCAGGGDRARLDLIELERPGGGHYFLSADADEVESLLVAGWTRTGETIAAYRHAVAGTAVLRRFTGVPGAGLDSHFYAPESGVETTLLRGVSGWLEERSGEAHVYPVTDSGSCAAGRPVWRLLNHNVPNRTGPNHRFTSKAAIRDAMVARGWYDEGVRFCAVD